MNWICLDTECSITSNSVYLLSCYKDIDTKYQTKQKSLFYNKSIIQSKSKSCSNLLNYDNSHKTPFSQTRHKGQFACILGWYLILFPMIREETRKTQDFSQSNIYHLDPCRSYRGPYLSNLLHGIEHFERNCHYSVVIKHCFLHYVFLLISYM